MVNLRAGDPQPTPLEVAAIERRLTESAGVLGAEVSTVCCEGGRINVFVGIAEDSSAILRFRAPPSFNHDDHERRWLQRILISSRPRLLSSSDGGRYVVD